MAYDAALADRIRAALAEESGLSERKMFGGLCFMRNGHMFAGIVGDELMARLGEAEALRALAQAHVRPMDFTGKPMKGYVYVDAAGVADAADLARWLRLGLAFTATLPPK